MVVFTVVMLFLKTGAQNRTQQKPYSSPPYLYPLAPTSIPHPTPTSSYHLTTYTLTPPSTRLFLAHTPGIDLLCLRNCTHTDAN